MKEKHLKTHQEVMEVLEKVPGVKEHMESFEVKTGLYLMKKRIEKNLTQEDLSKKSGVVLETIREYEQGNKKINPLTLEKLKAVLES